MPRAPRIEYENACYHIMARGNRREPIVFGDDDRNLFLTTLGDTCQRSGWEVFAWVLMDNHYHLVLRTPEPNLVSGMQWMQNAYTRRLNSKHRLWGHLFGGRYRSLLIEGREEGSSVWSDYLRTVIDYVHLNPARAGIIDGAERSLKDYEWSSIGQGHLLSPTKRPAWLMTREFLDLYQDPDSAAGRRRLLERYDGWIRAERNDPELEGVSLSSRIRRGWFWGSEAFREKMLERVKQEGIRSSRDYQASRTHQDHQEKRATEILREAERHFGMIRDQLVEVKRGDWKRAAVGWAIWKETLVSHRWIAEELNLKSAANASQQIRRFAAMDDRELPVKVRKWKQSRNVA